MWEWWASLVALTRRHRRAAATRGGALAVVAGSAAAALLLASCSPAEPAHRVAGPGGLVSPFTGEPVASLGQVLAIKIDNIVDARPQTGLQDADIVYVLPVEGGLSRFLAVFSARVPAVIGPVRSAREDDLNVLRQFGTPAFAYSGAAPHLLPFLHRARTVDVDAGLPGVSAAYYRDSSRVAPHNLYARSAVLLAHARGASAARDIGFRFGPVPAGARGAAVPPAGYRAGYPASQFAFQWSSRSGRWLVSMDGAPAMVTSGAAGTAGGPSGRTSQLDPSTIVIQHTVIRTSRFLEYGKPPPYAQSVGSGTAVVLRGGQAYTAHWSRPDANDGTAYTLPDGQRMTFATGQVWVLLVA
jgi:hypothetical protein